MIRNPNKIKSYVTKDNSTIKEIFHPDNSKIKNQSVALAVVSPKKETKLHYHSNSEEIYYILQGNGIIFLNNKKQKVKNGDTILIKQKVKHKIKNIGNKKLKFLCICSPAYRHNDAFIG